MKIRFPVLKIFHIFLSAILFPLLSLGAVSCTKQDSAATDKNLQYLSEKADTADFAWYYFTNTNFEKTDLPQHAPGIYEKPWTESVRISSAGCTAGDSALQQKAFAVVNRCGILVFDGDRQQMYSDISLFHDSTAGNLVFLNNTPFFSFYKNTFFNKDADESGPEEGKTMRPFLVQFQVNTGISYPVISYENLQLPDNSEITDFTWDGTRFLCSVKQITGKRTQFSYINIRTRSPLLSLSPNSSAEQFDIKSVSAQEFRMACTPQPFTRAPIRLKELLSAIPSDFPFTVTCSRAGGVSPQVFVQGTGANSDITAKACIAPTWAAALFSDGTAYLSGALYGRPVLPDTASFRLPKLPDGYAYGDFTISGTYFYAAWEESSFFRTGRSGFISVDLDTLLFDRMYKK